MGNVIYFENNLNTIRFQSYTVERNQQTETDAYKSDKIKQKTLYCFRALCNGTGLNFKNLVSTWIQSKKRAFTCTLSIARAIRQAKQTYIIVCIE